MEIFKFNLFIAFACNAKGFAITIIFYIFFSTANLDGLAKITSIFLFYCCYRQV